MLVPPIALSTYRVRRGYPRHLGAGLNPNTQTHYRKVVPAAAAVAFSRGVLDGIHQEAPMGLGAILLIVLLLLLVGALPGWPHSANWGYFPSGGLGVLLIVVLALLVMGRI
jgi:uncharacterized protein DUF3309